MRPRAPAPVRLQGRWLFIARRVWITAALLVMGLFLAGIPAAYAHYHNVCGRSGCGDLWRLKPVDVRVLEVLGLSVDFYAAYNVAIEVVFTLGFWAVAAFIFWRRSDDCVALFVPLMLVSFGTIGVANHTIYALGDRWWLPVRFVESLALISFFVSFYLFPDGRFVPRWTRVLAYFLIVYQVLYSLFDVLPDGLYGVLVLGQLGTLVFARIYRYTRVSGPVERQQTKWVLFGLTAAITILVGSVLVGLAFSALRQPGVLGMLYTLGSRTLWNLSFLLIPMSIAIAILRYRLWDIDVIINRALVYGFLSLVLLAIFALTDELLEYLFLSLPGVEESLISTVVSVVAIAVLFEPLRRRIQAVVDRFVHRRIGGDETSKSSR